MTTRPRKKLKVRRESVHIMKAALSPTNTVGCTPTEECHTEKRS